MPTTTAAGRSSSSRKRRVPPTRRRVRPRRHGGGRPRGSAPTLTLRERLAREQERSRGKRFVRRARRSYRALHRTTQDLFTEAEVERLAREVGFYERTPRAIRAFQFVLCCALAASVEAKRGYATVWRLLAAAADVVVARSAVTQRFGPASAALLQQVFERAVTRLPQPGCPDLLARLEQFRAVLARDATVLMLSPLLRKLFPATRTNSVAAAGKLHVEADVLQRRILRVEITGERTSDLAVARRRPVEPGTLSLADLGYFSHDHAAEIKKGGAHLLWRLKDNSNPRVVHVRHGVRQPAATVREGLRLDDLATRLATTAETFDLDGAFKTSDGEVVLRVVGCWNGEAERIHWYVTTLPAEEFTAQEVADLYALRWEVELLFKLLRSSCHLDHVDTSDPDALRTHLYASLLAATILSALTCAAAKVHRLHPGEISPLTVGHAAPLVVMPLMLLWLGRRLTREELADAIVRVLAFGCRDQNPGRRRAKWGAFARS